MDQIDKYDFDSLLETESTTDEKKADRKVFVLIIYDIVENKKRTKLVRYLQGYGFRVQKSCFEAMITMAQYNKIKSEIGKYADSEDSIRIYKIIGKGQVTCYGRRNDIRTDEVIII